MADLLLSLLLLLLLVARTQTAECYEESLCEVSLACPHKSRALALKLARPVCVCVCVFHSPIDSPAATSAHQPNA